MEKHLAEGGAHVVMACRKTRAANDLIQKWQKECSGMAGLLDIEVMELDFLSLNLLESFHQLGMLDKVPYMF